MKTIEVKSFFKTVRNEKSSHFGKLRPELAWNFDGFESAEDIAVQDTDKLCVVLNDALEKYGKSRLLWNTEDWDYVPVDVTVEALYADIVLEVTRTRTVTKETLAVAGKTYARYASLIGKSLPAAAAGGKVIEGKLFPIAGQSNAIEVFRDSLLQFVEVLSDSSDVEVLEAVETSLPVYEWLLSELAEMLELSKVKLADSL